MHICFIAEGSYPYVMGGVSSWIQLLLTSMPEMQFSILAIGATKDIKGQFKYKMPPNVKRVEEVFIEGDLSGKHKWGRQFALSQDARQSIMDLISGCDCDWRPIFHLMQRQDPDFIPQFLMSKDFFDISMEVCEKNFFNIPFTEFYWNVRSMMLPLMQILCSPIPPADVYHSVSTGYAGILGAYISYTTHKPFVLTEHGLYSREREEEIIKANWLKSYCKDIWINFFYSLSRKSYESADKVFTLFSRNKEIQMELGCPGEKIEIIPNGVDLGTYGQLEVEPDRGEYINIGAIVRVVPIKDIFTLLYAYSYAKERNPRLRLYVMGPKEEDQAYYEECLQLVNNMKLEDVIFTGTVRIAEMMGKLDIIALTSISEGQPFAVLEAMASRKPCVTTDVGSCRELLEGDRQGEPCGIVCPVMDYEAIGKAFFRLSMDANLRHRMGEAGYERVRTDYTKDRMVNGYRSLYQSYGGRAWRE